MDSKTFIKVGEAFFEGYQEAVNWEKATVLSAAVVKALALYAALTMNPKEVEKPDFNQKVSTILSEALQAALALNQHLSNPFASGADEEEEDGAEDE